MKKIKFSNKSTIIKIEKTKNNLEKHFYKIKDPESDKITNNSQKIEN